MEFALDMPKEDIEKLVVASEIVQKWTEGKSPKKVMLERLLIEIAEWMLSESKDQVFAKRRHSSAMLSISGSFSRSSQSAAIGKDCWQQL